MKRFVIATMTVAAIALCAQSWAQPTPATNPPPGTNAPAAPAANAPAPPVQSMNRMPAGGRATSERGATGSVTRAHHRRHAVQSARHTSAARATAGGDVADQLNRQELSQVQSGTAATMNPTTTNRMSVGGRATSGGPNH